jgi:hypothetical protein
MGYASISGRAVTNPDAPQAFAVCDRCARWFNHVDLRWQFEYRGRSLQNIRLLVCESCEDDPQPQLKPRIIPPDPIPIANARVEPFCSDEVDDRTTTNPALPNVDFGTTTNMLLSGLQFVDGVQLQQGELVLVMGQTDNTKNGIYKVSTGVWALQGFNNDTHNYIDASTIDTSWSGGVLTYGQLGVYLGAVNVCRGLNAAKLFQIYFENPGLPISTGTKVLIGPVAASTVNRIDFWTGIYMAGGETRITMDDFVRTPQQVGQASGNTNEIPGWSDLIPGSCPEDVGKPTGAPYGCATHQGLPPSMTSLPFSGTLWQASSNQSIQVWLNNSAIGSHWVNATGLEVTFNNYFWPDPGPGAPFAPISFRADMRQWVNVQQLVDFWVNALNGQVDWANGIRTGNFPPGGDTMWTNDKCNLVLWHNLQGDQVDFSEIYPNWIKPNRPSPWPFGWM